MAILHRLDAQGGFTCGDTITGLTAYAYPTSPHAVAAKRGPGMVAEEMIAHEKATAWTRDVLPDSHKQDADRLAELILSAAAVDALPSLPDALPAALISSAKVHLVTALIERAEKAYLALCVSTEQFDRWHFQLQRLLGFGPADLAAA
jgi:hypothetical protein